MRGHLSRKKTSDCLLARFYWPGIIHEVSQHCKSCGTCQKSAGPRNIKQAHLVPLPIIGEPFQRIAMDIVGPLIRSKSGNKYILVICDYSTRYPEAVPLKNIEAETIAEELRKFFPWMGVPQEILTDQGSNFTSQLPKEVYRMLKILLFAYREVPNESIGFSPFKLLFGRYVLGPLDILEETWEADPKSWKVLYHT